MAYSSHKSNPTKSSREAFDNPGGFSRPEFLNQDASFNRMSKGDIKPEVHFIGQITGGLDFGTSDGLFCEMIIDVGLNWDIISPPKLLQTQTSYPNADSMHIWSHPIDLHFVANDLNGWPKANFKVWRLDSSNKIDIYSYGVCHLPKNAGYTRLLCDTWTPTGLSMGKVQFDALSFYLGNKPRLLSIDTISKDTDFREYLTTTSSGKVIIEVECLMKNFDLLDISGQS